MITLEELKEYGADTEEAVARCMGNADFYLSLVGKALEDQNFGKLKEMIGKKDYDGAFSAAHALKGVTTNLSLTPLAKPIIEITNGLRKGEDRDYSEPLAEMERQLERLKGLA